MRRGDHPGPVASRGADTGTVAVRASTITGRGLLGYRPPKRARAAVGMLLSIPTVAASGILLGGEVIATADARGGAANGAIGAALAFFRFGNGGALP